MRPIQSIIRCLRRFQKDDTGIAAVETALILPLIAAVIFSTWELSMLYLVKKRTDHAATVLADLTTQSDTISDAAYAGYEEAVEAVMFPFNDQDLRLHVVGINVDRNRRARVVWQRMTGVGTGLSERDLPEGLRVANSFYVIAESEVNYAPSIVQELESRISLKDRAIMIPRLTTTITEVN